MERKELIRTFMMISNRKNLFGPHALYNTYYIRDSTTLRSLQFIQFMSHFYRYSPLLAKICLDMIKIPKLRTSLFEVWVDEKNE